jgi:fatty acid desaturase
VAKQHQHSTDSPADSSAGPLSQPRTLIPPPANDNRRAAALRIAVALAALAIAIGFGVLALQPFH